MDYRLFSVADFVLNESFQSYVLCTDAEAVAFWTGWRVRFPEKESEINQAVELVRLLSGPKRAPILPDKHAELHQLLDQLQQPAKTKPSTRPLLTVWVAAAAVVLLSLAGYLYYRSWPQRHETAYGVTRTLTLPDGSVVRLNGNSDLHHARHWSGTKTREVWLTGEAFFQVSKQKTNGSPVKFIVHAGTMDVEVLGTQFNVYNRDARTRVVLEEGQVRLRVSEKPREAIVMKPGETVEYSQTDGQLTHLRIDPKVSTSWRNGVLVFRNTPLSEVAERIEKTFGLNVYFEDPNERDRELTGQVDSRDITTLTNSLSRIFELTISRQNDTLIVRKDHFLNPDGE